MTTITHDMVSQHKQHHFVTEASTLGLAPGVWPPSIETNMGNKQVFYVSSIDERRAIYKQQNGCIIIEIFND